MHKPKQKKVENILKYNNNNNNMEEKLPPVHEPTVEFKLLSDRSVYNVINPELNKTLVEISGYDLQINFNMEYLNSIQDVEAAIEGLGTLFRDIIMGKLLEHKKQKA